MSPPASRTLLLGTAGHIDHGKTSLVRLLTGAELDTLPEERARGITIALGFTALDLGEGRRAALIDVPGHERLVRTMIAGATGLDAVLLVVSAVDGVMPQTREHLAILQLLGVRQGLVALTMADLVDDELLELAAADVEDTVQGTFLEGTPIVPTSTVDGRGRDALVAAIAALEAPGRTSTGPFRLPVDRAFSRPGFGTVVTGSSASGELSDGDTVRLLPEGREVRVRGIEVHGEKSQAAGPGLRVALNLAGVDTDAVPRGTVVAKGELPCPHMLDVTYTHLASVEPLPDGASVRVLLGTAECIGRLHLAADRDAAVPGTTGPAQLRLDAPLPCLPGDRFIVRRTSPLETLGGGVVVDPWTRRMKTRDRVEWGRATQRLADGDRLVWLERAGDLGLAPADWAQRGGTGGVALADRIVAPSVIGRLRGALVEALADFHAEHPLALGAHRRELRRGRLGHLPEKMFDALVDGLAGTQVKVEGPMVRAAGFEIALDAGQADLKARIASTVAEAGLGGLAPKDLHAQHPEPEVAALVRLLEDAGDVQQIAGIGWVARPAVDGLLGQVRGWFDGNEVLSPGEFKDLSGLTRKAAIPLLEWLDKNRYTAFGAEGRRTRGSRL
ncbi:MAG: selenocysteine-specific translation elongation factor [Myxococcota bacterium]